MSKLLSCCTPCNVETREGNEIQCEDCNWVPDDYEACGECGFDHEYEPNEAAKAHKELDDSIEQDYDWFA